MKNFLIIRLYRRRNPLLLCCVVMLIASANRLSGQQLASHCFTAAFYARAYSYKEPDSSVIASIKAYRPFGGLYNTATGTSALYMSTGYGNTADGYEALYSSTDNASNTAVGFEALLKDTAGNFNTAVGWVALADNNSSNNTAVGTAALETNTSGSNNTSVGSYALNYSFGSYNTVVGSYAFTGAGNESYSTALGYNTMNRSSSTGGYNTALGAEAMPGSNTGAYNTATGAQALYNNSSGALNTVNGAQALYDNTTGSYNVAVGASALEDNTTGTENTALGTYANSSNTTLSNTTVLGAFATVSASNSAVIGNSSVTSIGGYANWTNFSDGRYKKNIQQNVPGLAFINKLNPITYTLDIDGIEAKLHENKKPRMDKIMGKEISYLNDPVFRQAMQEKSAITYTGFVAQDVEKAADSVGFTFSGVDKPKDINQSFYGLRYGDFVVPLVKAVQELSAGSDRKDSIINSIQGKFDSLQTQVNELRAMLLNKNNAAMSGASLDQNTPNPFTGSTTIGYSLPKGAASAQMQITDINGKVLAVIPLSGTGKNTVTASVPDYASGTYIYSLFVNGKLAGARQMIAIR